MRNIRKIFVRAAAVLVFLFVLESTVRFLYEPYNTYSILSTEEYEELKGTLDTLFVGSSHSYLLSTRSCLTREWEPIPLILPAERSLCL